MSVTQADALQATLDNYSRLLFYCTQALGNPTVANINAALVAADVAAILRPQPSGAREGGYDWLAYQKFLMDAMDTLRIQLQRATGPIFAGITYCP